eukprot:TRINITY_DN2216_c0_g1_i1.p1 TRINITY_DN2216_c0_g1~~TRINITY_DN2216_c0_g1_i1.p1  ORF type:complete len:268 (-),score=92.08 TRINITY_DN2216_c0_g1_i1:25-828(-)
MSEEKRAPFRKKHFKGAKPKNRRLKTIETLSNLFVEEKLADNIDEIMSSREKLATEFSTFLASHKYWAPFASDTEFLTNDEQLLRFFINAVHILLEQPSPSAKLQLVADKWKKDLRAKKRVSEQRKQMRRNRKRGVEGFLADIEGDAGTKKAGKPQASDDDEDDDDEDDDDQADDDDEAATPEPPAKKPKSAAVASAPVAQTKAAKAAAPAKAAAFAEPATTAASMPATAKSAKSAKSASADQKAAAANAKVKEALGKLSGSKSKKR